MDINDGRYVVFGDLHGCDEKARVIYDYYGDSVDGYISTGDNIDGLETKKCLDALIWMGALCVDANHERSLMNAMCHPDQETRYLLASTIWPRIHDRVLESYGVYPSIPTPGTALLLKEKMEEVGHLQYIQSAFSFIEGSDFVVIHADVTSQLWQLQRQELSNFTSTGLCQSDERTMPYQLGEGVNSVITKNLTRSGLTKILLSGHFHRDNQENRVLNNGQHLLLATSPKNTSVVTYETWNGQMRII